MNEEIKVLKTRNNIDTIAKKFEGSEKLGPKETKQYIKFEALSNLQKELDKAKEIDSIKELKEEFYIIAGYNTGMGFNVKMEQNLKHEDGSKEEEIRLIFLKYTALYIDLADKNVELQELTVMMNKKSVINSFFKPEMGKRTIKNSRSNISLKKEGDEGKSIKIARSIKSVLSKNSSDPSDNTKQGKPQSGILSSIFKKKNNTTQNTMG